MNQVKKVLLAIGLFLTSGVVLAHPGHGTFTGNEVVHYLTSPVHIGVALAVVVLAIVLFLKRQSKRT
jgi:hypothetical protein